ncbi:hypothetical protein AgCh_009269 [Apium graveolens]
MCRNHHQTTNMTVKVSSSSSPKHHLNPFARPYSKTTPVYFVPPLIPLRYYYPHFQYSTYHNKEYNDDPPKQMAKNMYVKRFSQKPRFLPPRLRPRQVWRPKLGNEVAEKVHGDAPSPVVSAPSPTVPFVHGDACDTQNTSVMMRNIPNQYSRDELMKFLDKCCAKYKLEYDFLYLPIDFRTQQNKGYAFINFTKSPYAKIFQQGKDELVRHFEGSKFPCYCKHYLPVELSPPSNGDASLSTLTIVGRYLATA